MHSIRSLIAAAGIGLALLPAAAFADTATGDLLLTRSACSGASDVLGLSYGGGAYSGSCGSIPGATPVKSTYAGGNLPLSVTLDTSRPVHIDIDISSFAGGSVGSIGDETVGVALTATTTGNKAVAIGSKTVVKPASEMLTTGHYVQGFDLDISKLSATAKYKKFSLDLTVGGSLGGGFVGIGKSIVSFPVFDDAILVPEDPDEE